MIRGGALAAVALTLAACGPNEETKLQAEKGNVDNDSGVTSTAPTKELFSVTHEWDLPDRESLDAVTKTYCMDSWWLDEEGKRRPAVQADPLTVRVDGRCNVPLNSELVGGYSTPEQTAPGTAPVKLHNGDALGVECYVTGQDIQDVRGPSSSSNVWVGAVTTKDERVFVPEVNVGYVNEASLPACN
jgi:hypothetical protein